MTHFARGAVPACALLALLLCSCHAGRYAGTPQYALPESRATAARWLNDALAFEGRGVSEVSANELRLSWNEYRPITDTHRKFMQRELNLLRVNRVARPAKPGVYYELKVQADGGALTFAFDSGTAASKAEAAFRRLAQPLTTDEAKHLAAPHFEVIDGQVKQYRKSETELAARTLNWRAIHQAIEQLEMITGKGYGNDLEALLDWHGHLKDVYGVASPSWRWSMDRPPADPGCGGGTSVRHRQDADAAYANVA